MPDELVYDPRAKEMIKTRLYSFLYGPVREKLQQRLKQIITKNSMIHHNDQPFVQYKGQVFAYDHSAMMPRKINRLDKQLRPLMDDYLKDKDQLDREELPYVLNYINQVLNASNSLQDYLRLLPDSVHKPLQELLEQCGCRYAKLAPEQVQELQQKNQAAIQLMKQRMILNLIT